MFIFFLLKMRIEKKTTYVSERVPERQISEFLLNLFIKYGSHSLLSILHRRETSKIMILKVIIHLCR